MRKLDSSKPVCFRNPISGSKGRIICASSDRTCHVRWCYGLDAEGEPWTAVSRYVSVFDLVNVDEDLYERFCQTRCFSDASRAIERNMKVLIEAAA